MNKLYFGTNYVTRLETFKLNDVHYSRIRKVGGEADLVVHTSVLTELPNPDLSITDELFTTTEKRADILLEGYTPKVEDRQDQKEDLPPREEEESAKEGQEESAQVTDTPRESEQDSSANTQDTEVSEDSSSSVTEQAGQTEESPQVPEASSELNDSDKTVYAKNSEGEYNLGKRGAYNTALMNSLGLDSGAVERVLNGEQGTHKGFTFELR